LWASGRRDAIIIDDAPAFVGKDGYPALDKFISDMKDAFGVNPLHADDAIFILPSFDVKKR
jgi:hypothetical protein